MISVWAVVAVFSLFGPLYALLMGGLVKRGGPTRPVTDYRPHVVCLVPCLNEGTVVEATVNRLLAMSPSLSVVVVDDASDDDTPRILRRLAGPRVHIVRRDFPNARQGKGEALNHALHAIAVSVVAQGLDPHDVVIAVFDGDGNVDPGTLDAVGPWFAERDVGGVQIGVRINNRNESLLARMQDVEFAAYTEIFQRARNRLTSTGLGGNGQFVRLSALHELGAEPWTASLTEDLDLGIRLRLNGWRSVFEESVSVHQQGLHDLKRLLRQRTRWFQGHLQAWNLLPRLWRSDLRLLTKLDLSGHLVLPVLLLLLSVAIVASTVGIVRALILAPSATLTQLAAGPFVPWWYVIGFLATPLVCLAYWRAEPGVGFLRGLLYAHLYTIYTWIWFPAGWRATVRQLTGKKGWAKTARVSAGTALPVEPFTLFVYDAAPTAGDAAFLASVGIEPTFDYDAKRRRVDELRLLADHMEPAERDEWHRKLNELLGRERLAAGGRQ